VTKAGATRFWQPIAPVRVYSDTDHVTDHSSAFGDAASGISGTCRYTPGFRASFVVVARAPRGLPVFGLRGVGLRVASGLWGLLYLGEEFLAG
jgi:hypothetical protein